MKLISGSIANLSSAPAVAVSSFGMKVADPQPFLEKIGWAVYDSMRAQVGRPTPISFEYSEPSPPKHMSALPIDLTNAGSSSLASKMTGKVQRFGDNIDTDSVQFCFIKVDNRSFHLINAHREK